VASAKGIPLPAVLRFSTHAALGSGVIYTPWVLLPCTSPLFEPSFEKQSEPTLRGAGDCRATLYFRVGAKTLLLKTEQGASETNPPQLEPPQLLSTPLAASSRGNSALSHKIKLSLYSPV